MKSSKKILSLAFLCLLSLTLLPADTYAEELSFGNIIEIRGEEVVMQHRDLDGKEYFLCDVAEPIECSAFPEPFFPQDTSLPRSDISSTSLDGSWAITQTAYNSSNREKVYLTSLYKRSDTGALQFSGMLPLYIKADRIIFSEQGAKVAIFSGNLIFVFDLSSQRLLQFTNFDRRGALRLTLSPTGRYLAGYYSAGTGGERIYRVFDLMTGTKHDLKAKVSYWDLLTEELTLFDFSADGDELIYLDDRDGFPSLYLVSLSDLPSGGLEGERLITKKYSVSDFEFLGEDDILFVANRENPYEWSLYRYALRAGSLEKVLQNVSYLYPMEHVGDKVYFHAIGDNQTFPMVLDIKTNNISRFPVPGATLSTETEIDDKNTNTVLDLGQGLHGVLMSPDNLGSEPRPLFIWLHGGPYRQTSRGVHSYFSYAAYDQILNELRNAGAFVLKLDYTGSYGYGRAFAEAIKKNVGNRDVLDTLRAMRVLLSQENIEKVYLMGNSYGGYLALRSLVESPGEFSGAISINGVIDWEVLLFRLESSIFNIHFGGLPSPDNRHLYEQASILNRIPKLQNQQILLFQGQDDITVHPEQSDLAFKILKANNKNVSLINYPEIGHAITERSTLRDMCLQISAMATLEASCDF